MVLIDYYLIALDLLRFRVFWFAVYYRLTPVIFYLHRFRLSSWFWVAVVYLFGVRSDGLYWV